jgi:cytochrome b subunit of formate dehydrogenase
MTVNKIDLLKIALLCSFFLLSFLTVDQSFAIEDEECFECHGESDMTMERDGKEVSIYVNAKIYNRSIHAESGCISCHLDADVEELPHEDELEPVDCSNCHDTAEAYANSLHGKALQEGRYLAPDCASCHGKHDILPAADTKSKTHIMNVPSLCGSCHKEGTPVSQLRNIAETHVLEDYSQSIHGDGLYRRGLIVTAVCTSCHTSHNVLQHEDPASSINRQNIAATCQQCHAEIEMVHRKVIKGELWEKRPHEIPSCIECHQPHKVRRVFYEEIYPDEKCMSCHSNPELTKTVDGKQVSLFVDVDQIKNSIHRDNSCVKCHTNISSASNPVCVKSGPVDCSICHAEPVADYQLSQHGTFFADGNENAPYCTDCHGVHDTQGKDDTNSPTFARNIPELCGKCHREGQKAAVAYTGVEHEIIKNYTMSIHGKGLLQSGLMVTATCIDCHTAHKELPAHDVNSTVHRANIAGTCSNCHLGIYEEFRNSIHSPDISKSQEKLPACNDCHLSHTINRVDIDSFRQGILDQCGKCHLEIAETYFETFHGKVSKLGSMRTARCYDCHGAHNILPNYHPESKLSRANIIETCRTCHPNSNHKFVGYLTHATHHNKQQYPYLYYTFWFMTTLLVGTFAFFGLHTTMWLPRAIRERRKNGKKAVSAEMAESRVTLMQKTHIQRFDPFSRFLHLLIITSFLTLAITGMTIKFSDAAVFQTLSKLMGGYEVTGVLHRAAAFITFLYFVLHIGHLIYKKRKRKIPLKQFFTGTDTMVPRKKDFQDFWKTIKWFLHIGERPQYDRWTYWEKFDYFAVFWGVAIIGGSGLILWFPEFFTNIGLPGVLINVATIIHSDEALLATGFIFTIHFFNTHFRPDKFPMDPVIFTGSVPMEELKEDRPLEYARLIKTREIKDKVVEAPPHWLEVGARVFGLTCLVIGISVIVLIIYAMIFLYK